MLKKKSVITVFIVLMAALGLYACTIFFGSNDWSDILSPLNAGLAGAVLLGAYLKSRQKKTSVILLLLSLSCYCWVFGDIMLAVLQFQGKDTEGNALISVAYFLPNVLMAAGTLVAYNARNSKWRMMSGIIETLTIGILSVTFIWLVFFNKEVAAVRLLTSDGIISAVSIVIDIYLCVKFLTLLISDSKEGLPAYVILIACGIFLYSVADLVYYVLTYESINTINTALDLVYIICMTAFAVGALLYMYGNVSYQIVKPQEELGKSKWLFLTVFPVVSAAVGSARLVELLIYAVIIVLYHVAIQYIRLARENEELFKNQSSINEKLEKRLEEQLQEMTALANQDTITRLYNRRYFSSFVGQSAAVLRNGDKLAVIQFDVDRFKTINDNYGHDVGDKVIEELSLRLLEWNTFGAVLARLGGDEFAVMMTGNLTREVLDEFSRQIIELCSAPIFVEQQVLYVTVSVGISLCPDDARDSVTLLKNSDIAMYKAKAEGFNKYVFYSPLFKENITRKNEIEALLRKADLSRDFELVFQPQFALPGERLIGAEALVRWRSDEHGYIPPSVFIPVAEEIDYINRIGKWVLIKAVDQIVTWNRKYGLQLKMGINISPKQLLEDDFFLTLKTLIATSGVKSDWIDAEITENLMIEDKLKVKPIFDLFEELSISVSIDDFGSGYSSLGYLTKYHFDRIKIDKSLIDNLLLPGSSGVEVVKAIIAMAGAVGKTTIAEGVETPEQLEILSALGCRQVQGYLLGRPVHPDVFVTRFIEKELAASRINQEGQTVALGTGLPRQAGA